MGMASGPEQIKSVGVVGLGYWGSKLARCFHQLGVLKWVCDLDPGRVQEVCKLDPSIQGTTDYESMLDYVDALAIATPPGTHYEIAKRALLVGKHVFVEKPLATIYKEARELEELAEKEQRRLMTGHTYLYCPGLFHMPNPKTPVRMLVSFLNRGAAPSPASGLKWASLPHAASIALHFFSRYPLRIEGKRTDHSLTADLFYFDGSSAHIEVGDHMGRQERLVAIVTEDFSYYFRGNEPSEYITKSEAVFNISHMPPGEPLLLECQAFLAPDGRIDRLGSQVVKLVESIWEACGEEKGKGEWKAELVLELRPTQEGDLPLLLAWRHNPMVMHYFADGGESWDQHVAWWRTREEKAFRSYMIIYEDRPVGEVHAVLSGNEPEVGLYIGEITLWGKGMGRRAMTRLLYILHLQRFTAVIASVHPENLRSKHMFSALGFKFVKVKEDGYLLFRRELDSTS